MSQAVEPLACVLCGSETGPTRMQLVEWTEPIEGEIWSTVPRCTDRLACRSRVELENDEQWPVNDRTPGPGGAPDTQNGRGPETRPKIAQGVYGSGESAEPAGEGGLPWA
jgi:hypothetical protein